MDRNRDRVAEAGTANAPDVSPRASNPRLRDKINPFDAAYQETLVGLPKAQVQRWNPRHQAEWFAWRMDGERNEGTEGQAGSKQRRLPRSSCG